MIHTTQTNKSDVNAGHRLSGMVLRHENRLFQGTGGVSRNNRAAGFVPAFLDTLTGQSYRSRFADGSAAPMHLLEGLPGHLLIRARDGLQVKQGVISGFLRGDVFLTREEAAAALRGCCQA